MGARARRRADALLATDAPRIVLATGRYIGEGFDDPRLDTLVLAMPVAWNGTITQYAGRLHRHHDAKHEIRILDYVDDRIPVLRRMYAKRRRAYERLGYR
jgi:superfamily II DNA or RNA helicase